MTIRRGFNRLFVVAFVCWNLWNLWLLFEQARESAALVYAVAEGTRQSCISFKKCPPTSPAKQEATPPKTQDTSSGPQVIPWTEAQLITPECYGYSQIFPRNIDCDATFNQAVGPHTTWREFKSQITPAKLLYIEGIPAAIYILCWAVAATVLWIARGFGVAGGEKRG